MLPDNETIDKENAEILLSEWLNLWTPKFAKRPAQNLQRVHNLESGLIEIIKYGSKIFTEPDLKNFKATEKLIEYRQQFQKPLLIRNIPVLHLRSST